MPEVATDGATIHFEVYGSGPAVVLLHGAGGNSLVWFQQVSQLARAHSVVVVDHRGFGRSTCNPAALRVDKFGADLAAVLDDAAIPRAVLVCQSMGGWTGLQFASAHGDRVQGLILSATSGGIMTEGLRESFAAARMRATSAARLSETVLSSGFRHAHPDLTFLYDQIAGLNDDVAGVLEQLADNETPIEHFRRPSFPVLLVAGSDDPIFTAPSLQEIGAMIEGAAVEIIPGAGHSPYYEQPSLFNHRILAFLASAEVIGRAKLPNANIMVS